MSFTWAIKHPDLRQVLQVFGLYELDEPIRHSYRPLKGIIQNGPQCGLVALAMCTDDPSSERVSEIFESAKRSNFTNNGEIFSVDYMHELAMKYFERVETYEGALTDGKITEHLFNGKGFILLPYDCDRNHTPCKMNGHKAHWAAISGIAQTEDETVVFAKHGKSLNIGIWSLNYLSDSNAQLMEFSPDRKASDLIYVLPEGGVGGERGLRSRCILIYK